MFTRNMNFFMYDWDNFAPDCELDSSLENDLKILR